MRTIVTSCRLLLLSLVVSLVAPLVAHGQPLTRDQLRARKLAARKYEGAVVSLPSSAFEDGLRVCARETPSGILGMWKVSPKMAGLIDGELMVHLRKSGIAKAIPFSPKLYIRQYAGFNRDGARFVYVNAVLAEKGSKAAAKAKKAFPSSCSDISGSWGIVYDVKAKKFSNFSPK